MNHQDHPQNLCPFCGHNLFFHDEKWRSCYAEGCTVCGEGPGTVDSPDVPFPYTKFMHEQIEKKNSSPPCSNCGHSRLLHTSPHEGSGFNFDCLGYGCNGCHQYVDPRNPTPSNPRIQEVVGNLISNMRNEFEDNQTPDPPSPNPLYRLIERWLKKSKSLLQLAKGESGILSNLFLENAATRKICAQELTEVLFSLAGIPPLAKPPTECDKAFQKFLDAQRPGYQEPASCDCAQRLNPKKAVLLGSHHRHPSVRPDGMASCPMYRHNFSKKGKVR